MVRDIDSIRPVGQHGMRCAKTRLDAVVTFDDEFRIITEIFRLKGIAEPAPAFFGVANLHRAADEANSLSPGAREMADCLIRSLVVVGYNGILRKLGIGSHHQNERDPDFFDHLT